MMGNKKTYGATIDSFLLTIVKIMTAGIGIIISKILSVSFSLEAYGTYAQALLIVSTVCSITILGLTDATNYFFNSQDEDECKKYISTIFCIQYIVGIIGCIALCIFGKIICSLFKNDNLLIYIFVISLQPMINNLLAMLQILFVSIGNAKFLAIRNFIISIFNLLIACISAYLFQNIMLVLLLQGIMTLLQVIYFMYLFAKKKFLIDIRWFSKDKIKEILKFGLPMAIFVATNAISRDIDRYVIGFFENTESLAIYTNAAKVLPFDFLSSSFVTILLPILTRQISQQNFRDAQESYKIYLRIGYLTIWVIVACVIFNAKEFMIVLYDEKYLSGLNIFVIYLFSDLFRFANTSFVLSAKGKTKTLMILSVVALSVNFILNIVCYLLMGTIGPAISTLLITIILSVVTLFLSAKELNTSIFKIVDFKEVMAIIIQIVGLGVILLVVKYYVIKFYYNAFMVILLFSIIFIGIFLMLNAKKIKNCFKMANNLN